MKLQKEHESLLSNACWIWPEGYMYLYNHFAQFRYDFQMNTIPQVTPFFITADKGYRLYINGTYVCRGPARGYQSHWPFDEIDVRNYLRVGHNWIAVEAYTPGISTFQYLHQTKAGFLCAARWADVQIYSNADKWLMRRSPAHNINTARLSMALDFQEDWNAKNDNRDWIIKEEIPSGWNKDYFPKAGQQSSSTPFGQPPWNTVEPRGLPLLKEELLVPLKITSCGYGKNYEGYHNCKNISWHWLENELPTVKKWYSCNNIISIRTESALEFDIEASGIGNFRAITVDLGENTVGTLNVEVVDAIGDEIVDFHYFQNLRNGIPAHQEIGNACMIGLASRLRLSTGNCKHEFFHIMGIRHITVVVRDSTKPIKIKLTWRTALYPFSMKGNFLCSDSTLNRIYSMCRKTQQICTIDTYVDTPWREQAQWWGDARVQARNTFYLDGDARLLARGINP